MKEVKKEMKKKLKSIAVSIVVFAVIFGLTAPVQAQPYAVYGQVFDTNGVTPVDGVNVTVTCLNTTESVSCTTSNGGLYSVSLGNDPFSPPKSGDTLRIFADAGDGRTNTTELTATGAPQRVDLILEEAALVPTTTVTAPEMPDEPSPIPSGHELNWTKEAVMLSFLRIDYSGTGVNYTNLSAEMAITNVDVDGTIRTIPQVGTGNLTINTTAFGETFNVTISNDVNTKIYYYSVDKATPPNNETAKNLMVRIDTVAPTIDTVSPASGTTDVPVTTDIVAHFVSISPMNSPTLTTDTVIVVNSTQVPVAGAVTYDDVTQNVIFDPAANLEYNETYNVTITTGVEDLAGNAMVTNYSWEFTTAERLEIPFSMMPPGTTTICNITVDAFIPSNVGQNATIIFFGEEAAIDSEPYYVTNMTKPVGGTKFYSGVNYTAEDVTQKREVGVGESGVELANLTYDPAYVLFDYPLWLGKTWTTTVNVTGTVNLTGEITVGTTAVITGNITDEVYLTVPYGTNIHCLVVEVNASLQDPAMSCLQKYWLCGAVDAIPKYQRYVNGVLVEELELISILGTPVKCGDVTPYPDGDGIVDIGDVVRLLSHVGNPGEYPVDSWAGDCKCGDGIDIGDVVLLLSHVGNPGEYPLECCE